MRLVVEEAKTRTPAADRSEFLRWLTSWRGMPPTLVDFRQLPSFPLFEVRLVNPFRPGVASGWTQSNKVRQVVGESHQVGIEFGIVLFRQVKNADPDAPPTAVFFVIKIQDANQAIRIWGQTFNNSVPGCHHSRHGQDEPWIPNDLILFS